MNRWLVFTLIGPLAACVSAGGGQSAAVVGTWGGEHIGMTATDVAVSFDFDCAAGRIDAPLVTRADGRFAANGVYFPGHGGPTRVDEIPRALAATYSGSIAGGTMKLSIAIPAGGQVIGPLILHRDEAPRLFRCL
jgi:hypothetical protein